MIIMIILKRSAMHQQSVATIHPLSVLAGKLSLGDPWSTLTAIYCCCSWESERLQTYLWTWLWNSLRRTPSWHGAQGKLHLHPQPPAWRHIVIPLSSAGQIPRRSTETHEMPECWAILSAGKPGPNSGLIPEIGTLVLCRPEGDQDKTM